MKPVEITRLIRRLKVELSDAEWAGDERLATLLRVKLDMLLFKKSIGETHEVEF